MKKLLMLLSSFLITASIVAQDFDRDNVTNVSEDDPEMMEAINSSRDSFNEFEKAFKSKDKTLEGFAIKLGFNDGGGYEHMWLGNIKFKKGRWFGKLSNEPQYTTGIYYGQKFEINPEEISDWMYFKNGKLVGGKTMILLINRMPEEERNQYKQALGL